MPYSAEISRRSPTCILFVVDQSGSMSGHFGSNPEVQKAGFVADALNKTLQNLILACANGETIRNYFFIGVIGYGDCVGPALTGLPAEHDLAPLSTLFEHPARIEERKQKVPDGAGGVIELDVKLPIWFEPRANGDTPMCQALGRAKTIVEAWVAKHPQSFPPVVLHVTDGESTDGDPTAAADAIQSLATEDGNVLLFNLHVSSRPGNSTTFPNSVEELPSDLFAHLLFTLSSELPSSWLGSAKEAGYDLNQGARGFVFNGGIEEVINFFRIGTRGPLAIAGASADYV